MVVCFVRFCDFISYVYILLLICMFRSVYSVPLCCSVYCLCVNVYRTVLLPPGLNSIAVNKYIILYLVIIIGAYYLEGFQCLGVPSSESAPRRGPPRGRLHNKHSAVIADTWAARRDAKPGTTQVEALCTV
jgi:hypothetical protein